MLRLEPSVILCFTTVSIKIIQINLDIIKLKTTLHSNVTGNEDNGEGEADKENSNRTESVL